MEHENRTPVTYSPQIYFSESEINSLMKSRAMNNIKMDLADCERCLSKLLETDHMAEFAQAEEALTNINDIRKILHTMQLISSKKLLVVTEDILFKNDTDREQYNQNVAIEKPIPKQFNHLLHMRPTSQTMDREFILNEEPPLKQKAITLPLFFSPEEYNKLPAKISAYDLMHHTENTNPNILNKNDLLNAFKKLNVIFQNEAQENAPENREWMMHLRSLRYNLQKSNILEVIKRNPMQINLN